MPAQTTTSGTAYYFQNDTAPDLVRVLVDGDGNAIDLTNASGVTITIAHERYSHYYSPYTPIVQDSSCSITDAPNGEVSWTPGVGELSPPGAFDYTFKITWNDSTVQTVPSNTYEKLIIKTPPGGFDHS